MRCIITIIIFISSSASILSQSNNYVSIPEVKRSLLWPKLFNLIENEDWSRVEILNHNVYKVASPNCKIQEKLYIKYKKNISEKKSLDSKKTLVILIANNIVFELERNSSLENEEVRRLRTKQLFEELISIQFELQDVDFNYYKSLYTLIKRVHYYNSDLVKSKDLFLKNPYSKSINQNCI